MLANDPCYVALFQISGSEMGTITENCFCITMLEYFQQSFHLTVCPTEDRRLDQNENISVYKS